MPVSARCCSAYRDIRARVAAAAAEAQFSTLVMQRGRIVKDGKTVQDSAAHLVHV